MKFASFAEFIAMDGHGLYIWMAYGITFIVLLGNLLWPVLVRNRFVHTERQVQRRAAARANAAEAHEEKTDQNEGSTPA